MSPDMFFQLLNSLGFGGFLAWYCYYVTSKTLPQLVAELRAEQQETRRHFDSTLRAIEQKSDERAAKHDAALISLIRSDDDSGPIGETPEARAIRRASRRRERAAKGLPEDSDGQMANGGR